MQMPDYESTNKTAWFVEKMRSGWFSREEIVDMAETELSGPPSETALRRTMGQYWADTFNPKWGPYKNLQARGLEVVQRADGRRSIQHITQA
jgi:hypothetical protein